MASFNTSVTGADVLSSTVAAGNTTTRHHNFRHNYHNQYNHHHQHQYHHHNQQQQTFHNNNHHQHHLHHHYFERSATTTTTAATSAAATETAAVSASASAVAATAFLVPASSSGLQFDSPFLTTTSHFINPNTHTAAAANTSSASYTFLQIKREPCQVSEVTTSNNNCHHQSLTNTTHHHNISGGSGSICGGSISTAQSSTTASALASSLSSSSSSSSLSATSLGLASASAISKTMSSSSTLTTLVKIEASSPKVPDLDKSYALNAIATNVGNNSNNSVPIGIAVARKRPQESTVPQSLPTIPSLSSGLSGPPALPITQSLNKDMNCFGIRVADLGGVGTGCSNIFFTGNTDLMTGPTAADELGLSAASLQSVNRAPSTFWQYSNALPIESVISMSPATVGLQYSREPNRGQVVLLPATATPLDPFQQAAAAAFVWPSYIPQGSAPTTLQPPPNFIFPSMSPHSTLQATAAPSYATSLQLLGSNYLTAAAAAAAAAAATSTLCQHNQQTNSTSSSINLNLGNAPCGATSSTMSTSSSSLSTTRFMSLAATAQPLNEMHQTKSQTQSKALVPAPATLTLTSGPTLMSSAQPAPLLLPPSALKLEEWSTGEFMATAAKTTTTTLTAAATISGPSPPISSIPSVQFESRDKLTTTASGTTNLFEVSSPGQALNLVRLPTPPASANLDTATAAATCTPHLQQLLFQTASSSSPTPSLLNLSATLNRVNATNSSANTATTTPSAPVMSVSTSLLNTNTSNFINDSHNCPTSTLTPTLTPGTPLPSDGPINFKISNLDTPPQIVVGLPRVVHQTTIPTITSVGAPQMQDVNIQTDTPVCSEDESSTCPLIMQQQQQHQQQQQQLTVSTTIPEASIQCTPPLEPTDELYDGVNVQYPLELIKCHNNKEIETTTQVNTISNLGMVDNTHKCFDKILTHKNKEKCNGITSLYNSNSNNKSNMQSQLTNPEDLTGLELLSNISTSSLIKTGAVRVKQEPLDQVNDVNISHTITDQSEMLQSNQKGVTHQQNDQQPNKNTQFISSQSQRQTPPTSPQQSQILSPNHESCNIVTSVAVQSQAPSIVEPLGGLKLLCALAEQRIQEEEEVQNKPANANNTSNNANSTSSNNDSNNNNNNNNIFKESSTSPNNVTTNAFIQPSIVTTSSTAGSTSYNILNTQNSSFPSMQGLELPSPSKTRFINLNGDTIHMETKRKKRKHHSKSSKSSSSGGSSKKSAKSSKKNKKKKRHKIIDGGDCSTADLDFNDPQLQQELQKAFETAVDPNYQRLSKWPSAQEIFSIMETNMRMRLAEITRQYRKKKRKLEEISKSKKKSKCSQLSGSSSSPAISLVGNASLTLAAVASSGNSAVSSSVTGGGSHHLSSSPLCDYKFGNFSAKPLTATGTGTSYLTSTSFIRFADSQSQSTHPQFPPPDLELNKDISYTINNNNSYNNINSTSGTPVYKPVRLEPSSLTVTADQRSSGSILRLAQKTSASSSSKKLSKMVMCKEPVLKSRYDGEDNSADIDAGNKNKIRTVHQEDNIQKQQQTTAQSCSNLIDQSLMLTQEHLYRKETRVLTDMGGLFYAGIMKPLQPPDVYAITLDGERGNKSHIMSREEIFKDTILEVAPKTVESVPVGTRLCAYWSQQYRCLYPGRAIESESSDDGAIAQEFVSVEFDDGDSGRIRLQNIRFLLSDYPIVEYNDNPLYSLGKHKKSSSKSTTSSGGTGVDVDDDAELLSQHADSNNTLRQQQQHKHHQQVITSTSTSSSKSHKNDAYSATAQEIFAAKRSEKKRNKSLKKRSESNTITVSNGCVTSSSVNNLVISSMPVVSTVGDGGIGVRKHHKHKKHKKHKKHHHRKNLMEIGIAAKSLNNNDNSDNERNPNPPIYTASFVNQCEQNFAKQNISIQKTQEEEQRQEQEPENEDDEEEGKILRHERNNCKLHLTHRTTINEDLRMSDEVQMTNTATESTAVPAVITTTTATTTATIKMESTLMQHVKVKAEHFDLDDEDESTSNQMSEISEETKGDHNNSKGSKIAAFLPERQLWGWMGNAHRRAGAKGKARKQFYKTIKRGKETISVGDCAVFLSTARPDRPFIGNIESMWETKTKIKRVRVKWFYHPEEAKGCPHLKYPGALFESSHVDQNDVQTISHRCEVLPFESYVKKFGTDPKQYQSIYDNNDTYYLAGKYLPIPGSTKVFSNIPLEETAINSTAPVLTSSTAITTTNTAAATTIGKTQQQNIVSVTSSNPQKKRKQQQQTLNTTKTKLTILNTNAA